MEDPTALYENLMRKVTASPDPRQIHMSIEETSAYCNISKQALAQLRYTAKARSF